MLVFGRNVEESVVIYVPPSPEPREIRVVLCSAAGAKKLGVARARIGFEAPSDCLILRSELQRKEAPTQLRSGGSAVPGD